MTNMISKKILIAGIISIGALTFYVAPVLANGSAMTQTKSYCWQEKDCTASNGKFSSKLDKSGDCLSGYGYCYPNEEAVKLQIPIGSLTTASSLSQYIPAIYNYMIAIVGIVAIVMIMVGGLQYLTAGSSGRIGEAKSRIIGAVIGLIVALSAYTILQTINPATLQFATSLKIKMVAPQWAAQWCPNTNVKGTDYTGEFECKKKYGPNDTTTGKTGKKVPLTSGFCNGGACSTQECKEKYGSGVTCACTKLTYEGAGTPECVSQNAATACELVKEMGSRCQNSSLETMANFYKTYIKWDSVKDFCYAGAKLSISTNSGLTTSVKPTAGFMPWTELNVDLIDQHKNKFTLQSKVAVSTISNGIVFSFCKGTTLGCEGPNKDLIDGLCKFFKKIKEKDSAFFKSGAF